MSVMGNNGVEDLGVALDQGAQDILDPVHALRPNMLSQENSGIVTAMNTKINSSVMQGFPQMAIFKHDGPTNAAVGAADHWLAGKANLQVS